MERNTRKRARRSKARRRRLTANENARAEYGVFDEVDKTWKRTVRIARNRKKGVYEFYSVIFFVDIYSKICYIIYKKTLHASVYKRTQRGSFFYGRKYIYKDYINDMELRSLVFEALSFVEIGVRTQLEYRMSLAHGSRWYEDKTLFHNQNILAGDLKELMGHWKRSRETFKEHYKTNYDTSLNPPDCVTKSV